MFVQGLKQEVVHGPEDGPGVVNQASRHHGVGKQLLGDEAGQLGVGRLEGVHLGHDGVAGVDFKLGLENVVPATKKF